MNMLRLLIVYIALTIGLTYVIMGTKKPQTVMAMKNFKEMVLRTKHPRAPVVAMKTSDAGIELIKKYEGYSLTAYKCPAGIWTIGYGHIRTAKEGLTITHNRASELLRADLRRFEAGVARWVLVPLEQHQFDALVSFVYNVGLGNFRSSTLLKYLNDGHYTEAAHQLLDWNRANGRILDGLTSRRYAERKMFLG